MSNLEKNLTPLLLQNQLTYFGLWLIIPFCSFTSHTIFTIPPTLILFLIGTLLLLLSFQKARVSNSFILPLVCIFYFSISQTFIGAPFNRYMGVILAIAYYITVAAFGFQITNLNRKSLITKFINFSVIILFLECIWRLSHPATRYAVFEESDDTRWIYQYKFGGLMYIDSNAVAIHIIIILFFVLYLEYEQGQRWTKTKLVLIMLLLLTFSRAGWIGAFLGWIYVRFLREKKIEFYLINIFLLSGFLFFFYKFYLQEKIESDLSFQSKLEIIKSIVKYLSNVSFKEFLFGVGFSNSSQKLGIYAHNFFMVFFVESGLIGLLLILAMFIQFTIATNKKALFIIVPFLLTTLSSSITFIPFLYVSLALIFLMERDKSKSLNIVEYEN